LYQDFLSQALVPFEEPRIPLFVDDSRPPVGENFVDVEVGQSFEQPQHALIIVLENSAHPCPQRGIEGCP
jgi:hypothetical protein